MKITSSDFYTSGEAAYLGLTRAKAYRTAWQEACHYRAPMALRRSLRNLMRMNALDAVFAVRMAQKRAA